MTLTTIQYVMGTLTLIFVFISIVIGLKVLLRYFKEGKNEFLYIGLTWIIFSEIWWSASVSFLYVLFTGQGLSLELYFLIGNLLVPLGFFIWLVTFTNIKLREKQKIILIIMAIICALYEIMFFYFLFTDPSIIGVLRGPIDAEYRSFTLVFLMSGMILFVITGTYFGYRSIKSSDPIISLRAKFLIAAFISFFIGASLDGLKPFLFEESYLDFIYIINRIILISASLEFYCSFIMPKFIKRHFLKEQ